VSSLIAAHFARPSTISAAPPGNAAISRKNTHAKVNLHANLVFRVFMHMLFDVFISTFLP
jgi:hypothetical protein